MNRKQLTLLIVLGVVLSGLGWVAWQKQKAPYTESKAKMGSLVLTNFPLNDVEQIVINQPKATLTLAKRNDVWVVKDRGDYPANFANIRDLIIKFSELKVAAPKTVAPSRLPMLELVPPDKGPGTQIDFKDKSGKLIQSVLLGAKSMRDAPGGGDPYGGGASANGRYVMVGGDIARVALVTEPFNNADAKPDEWLNKEWFKVERHKSISVVTTNATNNWKLFRETDSGEWKLADSKAGETLDHGKSGVVTTSFGYPSFADVATNSNPAAAGFDPPAVNAIIETFDGFTYTMKLGAKSGEENYHFQFNVAGNFPKERIAGKDEKPEDKARLDKEYADSVTKREEKLKTEQAFGKWTYLVSKFTIDPFLKTRADLLADKKEEPKPVPAGPPGAGALDPLAPSLSSPAPPPALPPPPPSPLKK
ncbi:MAG: hypothetical protein QOF48_29 [Verrucomicrobiota bacterium]|jgi:hypothetical protein